MSANDEEAMAKAPPHHHSHQHQPDACDACHQLTDPVRVTSNLNVRRQMMHSNQKLAHKSH